MSPSVEGIEFKIGQGIRMVKVGLLDPEPFNPERFDQEALDVFTGIRGSSYRPIYRVKFVVFENELIVFSSRVTHLWMANALKSEGVGNRPQCAGEINRGETPDGGYSRVISDYSWTLFTEGILSPEESDKYKMTVLRRYLGDFFEMQR